MNERNCDDLAVQCAADIGIEPFIGLLAEAARRMIRLGTPMWAVEALTAENLLEQYRLADMYIGMCGGAPAFTCVLQESDDTFWGEGSGAVGALYVHKVAVADAFAGQDMVGKLLGFAADEARRRGKTKLRLDCRIDRMKVRAIYDRFGFRAVGEKKLFGWYHGVSYECDVAAK